jgi:hypothetical protein
MDYGLMETGRSVFSWFIRDGYKSVAEFARTIPNEPISMVWAIDSG